MLTVKLNGTRIPPFAVPSTTITGMPTGGKLEVVELPELVQPTSVPATPVKSNTIPTYSTQRLRFPNRSDKSPSNARGAAVANSTRPCFCNAAFVESTETVSREVTAVVGGVVGTAAGIVPGVKTQ